MCLVEEEYQLRQRHVAYLGEGRVELAQKPQQECRVQLGLHHQLIGSQHIHDTLATFGLHQVEDVERGLAKELVGALVLQLQQGALDGTNRGS